MVDSRKTVLSLARPGRYGEKEAAELLRKVSHALHDSLIQECTEWGRRSLLDIAYEYANEAAWLVSPLATAENQSSRETDRERVAGPDNPLRIGTSI